MDLTCQLAATTLLAADLIDRPMQVKYRPGGIGAVAYNHVVGVRNADPGLIVAASSGSALNIATGKFGKYGEQHVRWLAALATDYGMIAVNKDAPWNTLSDLLEHQAQHPGDIIFGGGGSIGSQDWIKTALLFKAADLDPGDIRFVAYEGGGEALSALLDRHIQVFSGDVSEIYASFEELDIKVLAVFADQRLPEKMSVIPTAIEQGYDLEWMIWRGYYMGPNVSDEAYKWWVNTFRSLSRTEEFQLERTRLGLHPFVLLDQEFNDFVATSVERQRRVAVELGLIP